jgi:sugar-specific transcriptional regulator TrmB
MKIREDFRDYADELDTDIETPKRKRMDEMSEVLKEHGNEVYINEAVEA